MVIPVLGRQVTANSTVDTPDPPPARRYNRAVPHTSAPAFTLSPAPLADLSTEVLVVFVAEGAQPHPEVDAATGGALASLLGGAELRKKPFETAWLHAASSTARAPRVLVVGAGKPEDQTPERWRRLAIVAGLAVRQRRFSRLACVIPGAQATAAVLQALAEGITYASLDLDTYKTAERDTVLLADAIVATAAGGPELAAALQRGRILGEATNEARLLANEPGNVLTPRVFAERGAALAAATPLDVRILDEQAIHGLGMGLIEGVARGSAEPPRLLTLAYTPPGVTSGPILGLVGKGVTFDTGGISIKPAELMDRMKDDMAGGAAVICAMRALSLLGAPIRAVGVVAAVENMPGGKALKPGDVIRGASGKTVEVLNTDAEGRLILGDALWYAREKMGATHLVDVATLTGACVIALGRITSGVFASPAWWGEVIRETGARAGDRIWPMPTDEEYVEQLKSDIADMANVGGRPGGAITAALFLKEFAGGLPWAHLDIAGTAWVDEPKPYAPKGATGVAVRTLAELAFTASRWVAPTA
jgi:leucyl aminopeptidase